MLPLPPFEPLSDMTLERIHAKARVLRQPQRLCGEPRARHGSCMNKAQEHPAIGDPLPHRAWLQGIFSAQPTTCCDGRVVCFERRPYIGGRARCGSIKKCLPCSQRRGSLCNLMDWSGVSVILSNSDIYITPSGMGERASLHLAPANTIPCTDCVSEPRCRLRQQTGWHIQKLNGLSTGMCGWTLHQQRYRMTCPLLVVEA